MTTEPIATRHPASARFSTQDNAGTQLTLGQDRAGWPVTIQLVGAGTQTDAENWNSTAAVILDMSITVTNPMGTLGGGFVSVEAFIAGQSAYGGADGWRPLISTIHIPGGGTPFDKQAILGKAHVLTTDTTNPRIRITNTGPDTVSLVALVAPIATNPSCP